MKKTFDFIFGISVRQLTISLVVVFIFNQVANRWAIDLILDLFNIASEDGIVLVFNLINNVGTLLDILLIVIVVLLAKKIYSK